MYGRTRLRPDTSEPCHNYCITSALKAPGRAAGSALASLRDCAGHQPSLGTESGSSAGATGAAWIPPPGDTLRAAVPRSLPGDSVFPLPSRVLPFGKPMGGKEGGRGRRAGPLPPGALPPRLPSHAAGMRGGMRQFPEVDPLPYWSTAAHISPGGSSPPSL